MYPITNITNCKNRKDLKLLNDTGCDFIHVDIMDGKFVKNKTMPFSEMKYIYKYTSMLYIRSNLNSLSTI